MRVLIVSQYFWPENFRINAIAESLVDRGITVEVLTGKPNYPDGTFASGYRFWGCQIEQWKGATVHRVPLIPRGNKSHLQLSLNYISFVTFGLLFGPWMLRKRQYDVIFVYGLSPILLTIPALFIGWLKGVKVATWVQDLWPDSLSATGYIENRFIHSVLRRLVSFIYRHSDLLLVQSRAFEDPVRKLASKTPILYYPNSVDGFFSSPVEQESPVVNGFHKGFTVMFAGNVGAAQGVDVIVGAALLLREYDDIHFVVMGDGSCRQEMMDLANRHKLTNIHFPGRYPVELMPGFMKKASALLVTLTDKPIFAATVPNKIQAYMAVGKPIIACLNGEGARIVVDAGAGFATPAEDAGALAESVMNLYELPASQQKLMGDNGRSYYHEHFEHEKLVNQLIDHLQPMTTDRKRVS
jgi:glycosyltransferase involved in cell wall biosynthesis